MCSQYPRAYISSQIVIDNVTPTGDIVGVTAAPSIRTARLTSAQAELHLKEQLGGELGYWRQFLINNRRVDRRPEWQIPFEVVRGRPAYRESDIAAFTAHQRSDRVKRGFAPGPLKEAMKAIGGWPTGRPFDALVTPQIEDGTGIRFISLIVTEPFVTYRLSVEQAREFAAHIVEAADVLDRSTGD
jgi:hypothetical protein